MSNSALVSYTNISPNKTVGRNSQIDRITPHCVVGQCSVEALGAIFAPISRQASSNYGIGYDGRIGMYVEEKDRSWCSSSRANDNRAVTIECASDTYYPYAFNDKVYNRLIELCVDICKRNGKTKLLWFNDMNKALNYVPEQNEMVLTVHRWFAATECPGNWMYSRMGDLTDKVTEQLLIISEQDEPVKPVEPTTKPAEPTEPTKPVDPVKQAIKKGDIVKVAQNASYYYGGGVPKWVTDQNWIVRDDPVGDKAIINKNVAGTNAINSPINVKYLTVVKSETPKQEEPKIEKPTSKPETPKQEESKVEKPVYNVPFLIKVAVDDLNIRTGAGVFYDAIRYIPKGIYTIVEVNGDWGRLKSKQYYSGKSVDGWIHLGHVTKL